VDATFIQFLTTQVGLGGLAAFALWINARAHQDALRREQDYATANREDKKIMFDVMSENTKALASLQTTIEASNERGRARTG